MTIPCTPSQRLHRWTTTTATTTHTTGAITQSLSYNGRALFPAFKKPSQTGPLLRSPCHRELRVLLPEMWVFHQCRLRWYRQKFATCMLSSTSRFWCPTLRFIASNQNLYGRRVNIVAGQRSTVTSIAGAIIIRGYVITRRRRANTDLYACRIEALLVADL